MDDLENLEEAMDDLSVVDDTIDLMDDIVRLAEMLQWSWRMMQA